MKRFLAFTLLLACTCCVARGDGGRLRFSKTAGPFLVTLFTTPEPLSPGPADFSVMVQDAATSHVLSDATIQMHLTAPDGRVVEANALRGAAVNKLLSAADVSLFASGTWHLEVDIRQGSRRGDCESTIVVEPGSRTTMLVWIFALLPVLACLLFCLNQLQKARTRLHSSH
jgi:hypothetical protein